MARWRFTEAKLKAIEPPAKGQTIDRDSDAPGLIHRVTANGARAYCIEYRIHGRQRRHTIGDLGHWSLVGSRQEARRLLREIDLGRDPLAARDDARAAPTVKQLHARYAEKIAHRRRTGRVHNLIIRREVLPNIGAMKVADVTIEDVQAIVDRITKRGRPIMANRVHAELSVEFSQAVKWRMRTDNPCVGIAKNPETRRRRYLSTDELHRLSAALVEHPNRQSADAVRLLLLTGARRGEALEARWGHIDFERRTWTKPSAHTKQKQDHVVPLGAAALALLSEMSAAADPGAEYLFPGPGEDGHQTDLKRFWVAICRRANLVDCRLHDLRHAFASILASSGASLPMIGQLLIHTQPGNSHLFHDPLRELADRVGAVVTGAKSPPRSTSSSWCE